MVDVSGATQDQLATATCTQASLRSHHCIEGLNRKPIPTQVGRLTQSRQLLRIPRTPVSLGSPARFGNCWIKPLDALLLKDPFTSRHVGGSPLGC